MISIKARFSALSPRGWEYRLAPERLFTLREVVKMTSLSRNTIYRQIATGRFPVPVKIGRNTRWRLRHIQLDRSCARDRRGAGLALQPRGSKETG